MSKKRFVLASVVMVALSTTVYAAPVNIVDNNGNIGKEGQTFTAGTGGNITLGENAGAANGKGKGPNAQGNNIALGAAAGRLIRWRQYQSWGEVIPRQYWRF